MATSGAERRGAGEESRSTSIASSIAELASESAITLKNLAEKMHDPVVRAEGLLNRMLSTVSHISTASSLTGINEAASDKKDLQKFRIIGQGTCGKVYALWGTQKVAKFPINDGQVVSLYNDACLHKLIEEAFALTPSKYRHGLSIPKFEEWIAPDSQDFWDEYGRSFPPNLPEFCLISERIFPLPEPLRHALVTKFAPRSVNIPKAMQAEVNKDCLVRIYMGRKMDAANRKDAKNFHLRNFEIHLNEMEMLNLPLTEYAIIMADALAILHWRACVDADDVEFVLGSTPLTRKSHTAKEMLRTSHMVSHRSGSVIDFKRRSISLWLLDFNNCRQFTMDEKGVGVLVRAFWNNDPYYPRPHADDASDVKLWELFRTRYLNTSHAALEDVKDREKVSALPDLFVREVEEEGKRWKARRQRAGRGSLFAALAK